MCMTDKFTQHFVFFCLKLPRYFSLYPTISKRLSWQPFLHLSFWILRGMETLTQPFHKKRKRMEARGIFKRLFSYTYSLSYVPPLWILRERKTLTQPFHKERKSKEASRIIKRLSLIIFTSFSSSLLFEYREKCKVSPSHFIKRGRKSAKRIFKRFLSYLQPFLHPSFWILRGMETNSLPLHEERGEKREIKGGREWRI